MPTKTTKSLSENSTSTSANYRTSATSLLAEMRFSALPEQELIFESCTQCSSYKKACYEILKDQFGVTIDVTSKDQKIRIREVFSALDNSAFMNKIPPFLNQRSTLTNIKMIKASVIIGYKKLMPYELITSGIIAFQLMEKQLQAQSREKKQREDQMAARADDSKLDSAKKPKEQSYQMSMYLPQDPVILNQTMMLCNRVMSEVAIKKWIKEHNTKRRLECSQTDVLNFHAQLKEIESDIKEKWKKQKTDAEQRLEQIKLTIDTKAVSKQQLQEVEEEIREKKEMLLEVPDLPPISGYLTCHEFLFLLCNAVDRQTELRKQKAPEIDISRKVIDDFNPDHVNGIRLDYLYMLDTNAWESWLRSKQPSKRMIDNLNAETADKKIIINNLRPEFQARGAKNLEEDTLNAIKNAKKTNDTRSGNEHSNRDSQSGVFHKIRKDKTSVKSKKQRVKQDSLSVVKEAEPGSRSFSKETILEFRKKISDNHFFKKLQIEVAKATEQLCKTRLGGQADIDYFNSLHNQEFQFGSPTRQLIKNDKNFRSYVAQNPVKGNFYIDFRKPVAQKKYQRLLFYYSKVNDIKSNLRKIRKSQTSAIKTTYDALKGTKDNIFSEMNVERQKTNKTIIKALKSTRVKRDDDTGLTSPHSKEQQMTSNVSRRFNGQRLWDEAPFRNETEFANSVKVKHKEPMEPQDDPSKTFYGVMSKVYQEAYQTHINIVNSPEYGAQKETEEKPKKNLLGAAQQKQQSALNGLKTTPNTLMSKINAKKQSVEFQPSKFRPSMQLPRAQQSSAAHQTMVMETPYTQQTGHKKKSSLLSDYLTTPKRGHRVMSHHQYTQPDQKYKSERVLSDEGITEATNEVSKREETGPSSNQRIRSAAASVIFRKWGYNTSKLLKNKSIDFDTFIGNRSLKEAHTAFMYRIDNALEKEVNEL